MTVLLLGLPPEASAEAVDADYGDEPAAGGYEIMYNVSFPADIHAYLDPGDLSGRGQIFSDHYIIENHGNTDIIVKINHIDISYSSAEEIYELSENEILDDHSHTKKLNIEMIWENEEEPMEKVLHVSEGEPEEYVLYLAAPQGSEAEETDKTAEGSRGYFYFTGTLSSDPDLVWEDGEIVVSFSYEIIGPEHDEMREAAEELLGLTWDSADIQEEQEAEGIEGELLPEDAAEAKIPEETDSKVTEENGSAPVSDKVVPKEEADRQNEEKPETEDKEPEGENAAGEKEASEDEEAREGEETNGEEPSGAEDKVWEGTADGKDLSEAEDKVKEGEGTADGEETSGAEDKVIEGEETADGRETSEAEEKTAKEEGTADEKEMPEAADKKEMPEMEETIPQNSEGSDTECISDTGEEK